MDLVFVLVLPGVLWIQAWHLLDLYANPRTLGLISAAVAIVLFGVVLFQDKLPLVIPKPDELGEFIAPATAVSVFVLVWAVYAVLVAGIYLWDLDTRSLGFYSLLLGLISLLFAVYFFVGDKLVENGDIIKYTWLMGVVALLLAVLAGLTFFYMALRPIGEGEPTTSTMRTVTGWFYLVFSAAITVLGGLLLLGIKAELF